MIARRRIKDLIADGAIVALQDGNHGEKHPTAADYVDEGIPFLMARDFRDGQIDLGGACKIPKSLGDSLPREWFVHLRFPGHENHPRVASPLGEIPQGWEVKKLSAVAEVNRAQINARSAPEELHYRHLIRQPRPN